MLRQSLYTKLFLLTILLIVQPSWQTISVDNLQKMVTQTKDVNLEEGVYDLLIIAPNRFRNELSPLVKHKEKLGIRTIFVDTDTVYQQMFWQGRDAAEKVKYFIKAAVENWSVHYVLLVGGRLNQGGNELWWVPVRYSYLDRPYENYSEPKFLSDLYFADLYNQDGSFSSWDDNDNGVFGEWPLGQVALDHPDLIPDVSLGRLPCLNALELRVVVHKIIRYEDKVNSNDSWFKTMVVAAGDTYPGRTPYFDGEVYTQQGLDLMTGFRPVRLWTSDKTLRNGFDIVRAVNRGCGFLWLSGHGNPKTWGTHPPNNGKTWIDLRLRQLIFLHNRLKLPVVITGSGCFNSMFNVSIGNPHWVYGLPTPFCFSWALIAKRIGGSIATIGATAFSYESPDISLGYGGIERLDLQFFSEYSRNQTHILGDTWGASVAHVYQESPIDWNDSSPNGSALVVKNLEQWVLFGDPSLKIGGYR